ncbi:MAG: phage portal protein [Deltaproteobacteria bacterium]
MTREELEKKHPDYEGFATEWRFFLRSYFGGKMYREGNYLLKHPFESASNYARRKATAYYYNYCGPIVDIFVAHLFRKGAVRNYGSLSGDPLFKSFLANADMEGASLRQFMREAHRFAAIYGRVSIVVDMPSVSVSTKAEAIVSDIRPYVSLVTPENLIDWAFEKELSGRPSMSMVKIKEDKSSYRIWTRQGWELWRIADNGREVTLEGSGEHDLGAVPVVNLYNRKSGIRMLGVSDIQDVADINKNIYYLCSDAKEIIENTAFPMLAVPYEKGGGSAPAELGPKNILQFDPELPNARPFWLEAPHSSLTEIREWVRQDISEIFRIAKMGGVKATEDVSAPRSGVALELEYQQLNAALSEKADNIEQAEREVCDMWARWQGERFDGTIDYPDDFSVRDLDRDIERLMKVLGARIESVTFGKELQKSVVRSVLPKIQDEVKDRIMEEIDGFELGAV